MLPLIGSMLVSSALWAADVGITRLPEATPAWTAALRQAGVPFANDHADAALVWGLGVDLSRWDSEPGLREVWIAESKHKLADQAKVEAAAAAAQAGALPDDADPKTLRAMSDDFLYLVEAYGPNVPASRGTLQRLYESARAAADKGQAEKLKTSAVAIADALSAGARLREPLSVRGEERPGPSAKEIPLSKPEKKWTFEERAAAIKAALRAKVATGPKNLSAVDVRRGSIDGIPAELLDDNGRSNAGVYRYFREGRKRIMKITRHEESDAYPEEGYEHSIDAQIQGGIIGSLFGAPKILRTGVADQGYHRYYFIEMEEAFPGQSPRSFKDAAAERDKEFMAMLGRPRADGVVPAVEIADKFVDVLEYGVAPYDGDFLVTPDGRLAWIDTNWWTPDKDATFPEQRVKVLREAYYFLARLGFDREAGRAYAGELLKRLRESDRIGEKVKDAILKDWIDNDPELLKKLGLPTDLASLRRF